MRAAGVCLSLVVALCCQPLDSSALGADGQYEARLEAAIKAPGDTEAARRFFEILPKTTVPFAPLEVVGVVEGDRLLTYPDGLTTYLLEKDLPDVSAAVIVDPELKVHTVAGVDALWGENARTLRYAVVRATFATQEQYDAVVLDMAAAAGAWEAACDVCRIEIDHMPQHDGISQWDQYLALAATDELRFIVVYSADPNGPIASAFFPSDQVTQRLLTIYPDYFGGSQFPAVGVLRHELGHTLGYRHEQISGVVGCDAESSDWRPVTEYDSVSVMHYFCGGAGTRELELSVKDKEGHLRLYGPSDR